MADNVQIRKAKPSAAEMQVIIDFNIRMAEETENLILPLSKVKDGVAALFSDPSKGIYYVAKVGERIAAQLLITYEWSDWRNSQMWWIQSVYVHPDFRRQGLYKRLYQHIREEARGANAGGLRLYVDKANKRAQATVILMPDS